MGGWVGGGGRRGSLNMRGHKNTTQQRVTQLLSKAWQYNLCHAYYVSTAVMFALPPSLEVKETPSSGRGLYTVQAFPPGTQLLTAQPLAHVVKETFRDRLCHNCFKKIE